MRSCLSSFWMAALCSECTEQVTSTPGQPVVWIKPDGWMRCGAGHVALITLHSPVADQRKLTEPTPKADPPAGGCADVPLGNVTLARRSAFGTEMTEFLNV